MLPYVLTVIKKIFDNLLHSTQLNNFIKILVAIWLFFAGIHTYFYCIVGLTFLDVITGIAASMKKGEVFKSRILRKGLIEKLLLYIIMLIAVFTLELVVKTAINYSTFYMVLVATISISCYELTSILENIFVLNPELKFIQPLIKLTNKIGDKTVSIADTKIDIVKVEDEKKE